MEEVRPKLPGLAEEAFSNVFSQPRPFFQVKLLVRPRNPFLFEGLRKSPVESCDEDRKELRLETAEGHVPPLGTLVDVVKRCAAIQDVLARG